MKKPSRKAEARIDELLKEERGWTETKKENKAIKTNINDPAFARIHEDRIREYQDTILLAGMVKQEHEEFRRKYHDIWIADILSSSRSWIDLSKVVIKMAINEIRRLRGWLPN